jgi:hypothetical protein
MPNQPARHHVLRYRAFKLHHGTGKIPIPQEVQKFAHALIECLLAYDSTQRKNENPSPPTPDSLFSD